MTTTNSAFVVVDVETANADFASICQIGLVHFESGHVVSEWQSLVNPEDDFDTINISIHGITGSAVAASPTWPIVWATVEPWVRDKVTVSHTAFDRVSIGRACQRYALPASDPVWLDSARVARRAWPEMCGRTGYGLRQLAEHFRLTFT